MMGANCPVHSRVARNPARMEAMGVPSEQKDTLDALASHIEYEKRPYQKDCPMIAKKQYS